MSTLSTVTASTNAIPPSHDWLEAIDRLEGAYSENTLRSYRADFALFDDWCKKARRAPLPASPETVAHHP